MTAIKALVFVVITLFVVATFAATPEKGTLQGGVTEKGFVKAGEYKFYTYETDVGLSVEVKLEILTDNGDADVFVGTAESERALEHSAAASTAGHQGRTRHVAIQIPGFGQKNKYSVSVLGRSDTDFSITIITHGFKEPVSVAIGSLATNDKPVLTYFQVDATSGSDLNVTFSCEASECEFFVDTVSKWPSFSAYRWLRHIPSEQPPMWLLIPVPSDGPVYFSMRPTRAGGKANLLATQVRHTVTTLLPGQPAAGQLSAGQYAFFVMQSSAARALAAQVAVTGDVELFAAVNGDERPTIFSHSHHGQPAASGLSLVVPMRAFGDTIINVGVQAKSDTPYAVTVSEQKQDPPAVLTVGVESINNDGNSLAKYYKFVPSGDSTDVNITVTASVESGAEFFLSHSVEFPSFSGYDHFNFVPPTQSVSSVHCVHNGAPVYIAVRPVSNGATTTVLAQQLKHLVTELKDGVVVHGEVSAGNHRFYTYTTLDGSALEFVLNVISGDADMFVTDDARIKPVSGLAALVTSSDAPRSHKNIVLHLPPNGGDKTYQIGVRGTEDAKFSVSATTHRNVDPTKLRNGEEAVNADKHTMMQFYEYVVTKPDTDLNVTITTDSLQGAQFFADLGYKYPSFNQYGWHRHVSKSASLLICVHEPGSVYLSVRALAHDASATVLVKESTHKIGVMSNSGFM